MQRKRGRERVLIRASVPWGGEATWAFVTCVVNVLFFFSLLLKVLVGSQCSSCALSPLRPVVFALFCFGVFFDNVLKLLTQVNLSQTWGTTLGTRITLWHCLEAEALVIYDATPCPTCCILESVSDHNLCVKVFPRLKKKNLEGVSWLL